MRYYSRLIVAFFLSLFLIRTNAQQKHFLYIESEDRQAFAVVLNGKVFSSSDYGYVIVPKLTDGTYNFTVSFPMNKFPDQTFKCIINKKDVGYKLENNTGKGWALQNMQTQKVVVGNSGVAEDNAFTNMLSDVVGDSTLAKKDVPANNKKTDTVAAASNIISDTNTTLTSIQTPVANVLNNATEVNSNTKPQKISETKMDTGTNMVFVDKTSGTDTIRVFVPSDSIAAGVTTQAQSKNETADNNLAVDTMSTALHQSSRNTDTSDHSATNPFYKSADVNTITVISSAGTATGIQTTSAVKQDCSNMVSDNDMDKIKRKMFVQKNDNDMVQTALHYINDKCITTEQVRVLSDLFSSDDGRYNLYDILYKHVYDYGNYPTLGNQIIDPYYKKRFNAMLR